MSCRDKHTHCTQLHRSFSTCRFHSATHTAVRVLSLHPPPLILKGQGSSPCQMEFIHSRSSANVILAKLTVRVGEYCECQGSLPAFPFLLFSCFMCLLDIMHKYTHTTDIDFFSVHLPGFISDLLAGEKQVKKACDVIFLNSSHYLDLGLSSLWCYSALSEIP